MIKQKTNKSKLRLAHAPLGPAQLGAVAGLFATLSEPSRLQILQALQAGPRNVGQLVEQCGLKQANVSKQLGMLLGAGVIARRREGNHAIYSIRMPMVYELCNLVCRSVASHAAQNAAALRG